MRKILSLCILVSALFGEKANGQCSYSITTNTTCLPAKLSLNSASAVSKISWKKNNVEVQATHMKWKEYGTMLFDTTAANDMFVDNNGNVYLCYLSSNTVVKWNSDYTSYQVVAGGNGGGFAANQLSSPVAIYVDASGNLYIADQGNDRIQKWAPGAVSGTTVAGGNGSGSNNNQFLSINDLYVTSNGNIYVADNNRIMRWAPGATTGTLIYSGVTVREVAVDGAGTVYFSPASSIFKVTSTTTYSSFLADGVLSSLWFDVNGNLFYTKPTCVKRLPAGLTGATNTTVIAGSATVAGVNANQFESIVNAGFDATGRLYVNDGIRTMRFDLETDLNYTATSAGTYTATVTTVNACTTTTGSQVIGTTAGPTITLSNLDKVCAGTTVLFTANVTNEGSFPGFQWKKNGVTVSAGTGLNTYSSNNLSNGDKILCIVTNNNTGCGARDSTSITVNPSLNGGNLIGTSNCIPSTLLLNNTSPSRIIWSNNNTQIDTTECTWDAIGTIVAGNNGTGPDLNQLGSIYNIGIDASRNLYVLDISNSRVLRFSPGAAAGIVVAGGNGNGAAANQIRNAKGMYVTPTGVIYLAESGRLRKWMPGATEGVNVIRNPSYTTAISPNQLFVDKNGNVFFTQSYSAHKVSADGMNITTVAGSGTSGSGLDDLNGAWGLFVDDQESIYIADQTNHRILKWAKGANIGVRVAGQGTASTGDAYLSSPQNITVDAAGNMYILDWGNKRIQKWAARASTGTTINSNLINGRGFCFDDNNDLYVADNAGFKITKFTASFNKSITVNASGNYTISLFGMTTGCYTSTNIVSLSGSPAPLIRLNAATVCEGSPLTINAVLSNEGANPALQWKKNGNAFNHTGLSYVDNAPLPGDAFSLLVSNTANGCYQSDSLLADIKPLPTVSLSASVGLPATISLTSNMVLPQVAWTLNGTVLDTTHNWKTTPKLAVKSVPGGVFGMTVDKNGAIYTGGTTVRRYTDTTTFTTAANTPAGFSISGLELNKNDELYVAFAGGSYPNPSIIQKVNPLTGVATTVIRSDTAGSGSHQLNNMRGIVLDDSGYVYIADYGNYRIQKWMPGQKTATTVAGGNGEGNTASHVTSWVVGVDKDRNVYAMGPNPSVGDDNYTNKWAPGATAGVTVADTYVLGGNYQIHVNRLGHVFLPLRDKIKYYRPGDINGRIIFTGNEIYGVYADTVGNVFFYKGYANDDKIWKYELDTVSKRQVNTAGLYKIEATAYNGCTATNSVMVYAGSYTFNGTGNNWADGTGWSGNTVPPSTIPAGYIVIIDPANGECVFNGNLTIEKGASITVMPGKTFRVTGNLVYE